MGATARLHSAALALTPPSPDVSSEWPPSCQSLSEDCWAASRVEPEIARVAKCGARGEVGGGRGA